MALVNPHLDYPFRFGVSGHAAANEQGSSADVESCVTVAIVTPPGFRVDEPDFGAKPAEFSTLPLDLDSIIRLIERSEPRATVQLGEDERLIGLLESHLKVYVDRAEGS